MVSQSKRFHRHFYKKCWSIIKFDLIRMIQYIQRSIRIGGETNWTFLDLIPKERNIVSFSRFMPISLYNIISKIIANRLQKVLHKRISPNQGGFVAKRQIWDNIVLVQDEIHSRKDRGEKGMVINIDMEKSFDRVRCNSLLAVLHKFGFNPSFI
jgi:hypothetical protein